MSQKWSEYETKCLIGIYAENFDSLEKLSRKKPIFERMAAKLLDLGFNRTNAQVSKKIANLRLEYAKKKPGPTGDEKPDWVHYDDLHKILHERPALNPEVAETSKIGFEDETSVDSSPPNETPEPDNEPEPMETPPSRKKARLGNEAVNVCSETLAFMKQQAALRQQDRVGNRETSQQLICILDRLATSAETLAANSANVFI